VATGTGASGSALVVVELEAVDVPLLRAALLACPRPSEIACADLDLGSFSRCEEANPPGVAGSSLVSERLDVTARAEAAQRSATTPTHAARERLALRREPIVRGYLRPCEAGADLREMVPDERGDVTNRPLLGGVRDLHATEDQGAERIFGA